MSGASARWTETDVPARLDRLPWSRWHRLVVVAAIGVRAEGQSLEAITKPLSAR